MNARETIDPKEARPWLAPALLLWGVQTEAILLSLGLAVLLEAPRWISVRWSIVKSDFNRLWNFNAILFIAAAVYLFISSQGPAHVGALMGAGNPGGRFDGVQGIAATAVTIVRWLPLIFCPFMLAHAWSAAGPLNWGTFSLYQQKRSRLHPNATPPEWVSRQVHPNHLFFVLVLLASTASVRWPGLYLIGVAAALWIALRPTSGPRHRDWIRAALLLLALVATLGLKQGLTPLRDVLQAMEERLLQGGGQARFDQGRNFTAMGNVGRLKQSGSILLRIQSTRDAVPGLLREATFNRYRSLAWSSGYREFTTPPEPQVPDRWVIQSNAVQAAGRLTIARQAAGGSCPLALPQDVTVVEDLPVQNIERNGLGSVRVKDTLDIVQYTAEFGRGGGLIAAPEPDDLDLNELAEVDRDAIQSIASELGLTTTLAPSESLRRIEAFFARGFTYSLWQEPERAPSTESHPLVDFLLKKRTGHCEFYASATVLLLRAGGVPSRYAVGYSVMERHRGSWIARGRDAHAWALAWIDGQWQTVDTTPGIWRDREREQRFVLQPLVDAFSDAWFHFNHWRQQSDVGRMLLLLGSLGGLGWLAWRQLRGGQWKTAFARRQKAAPVEAHPGMDSELFDVIHQLQALHGNRPPYETLQAWMRRILGSPLQSDPTLHEAIRLHERLRFDPKGITPDERANLHNHCRRLRAQLRSSRP